MKIKKKLTAAVFLAFLSVGTAGAAEEARIEKGIYIDDMDMSGLTYEEAEAKVEDRIEQIRSQIIHVKVGKDDVQIEAGKLGLRWDNKDVVEKAFSFGNRGNAIKRYKDQKDLARSSQILPFTFSAEEGVLRKFVEEDCKKYEKKAQEASISADGNGGFDLQPGVTGQVINVDESVKILEDFIAGGWQGEEAEVSLAVELDEPKGTKEDLETIQDLLGTFTTWYGTDSGRNKNVERGAELINDHVVYPGETFSVCEHLVPFTAENGYELANEYAIGTVVQGYGGGICQVSTTLYNALLRAELEIVERHNHTMTVNYVDPSMDAAIAEGNMDLVFRNNLDTPILISGYAYGGELTFSIWGKETRPEGRTVSFYSNVSNSSVEGGTRLYAAPDQPVGYFHLVSAGMTGMSAEAYKEVTYNGETTVEQINSSVYEATPTTYEVGTLGASDALLAAIYANDLAAAQAAAAGGIPQTETQTSETQATETPATDTPVTDVPITDTPMTDVPMTDAPVVDPGGEVYWGDTPTDPGVVTW